MTIAIAADNGGAKEPRIWAEVRRREKNGDIVFRAINGAWLGRITPDGTLYTSELTDDKEATTHKAKIVWEGEVPDDHGKDYNTALAWIREQLK